MSRASSKSRMLLSLIGPPGSGKGSYGRHLSKALNLTLVGMSDVLRKMRPFSDLSSGQLIDDQVVTDALLEYLKQTETTASNGQPKSSTTTNTSGFLLDGFPRTNRQIQIMRDTWPTDYIVGAALKLAVPDQVCETKLLGRRICTKCNGNFNVNGVDHNGWNLPPSLPTVTNNSNSQRDCSEGSCADHWIVREDDTPLVVRERLNTYHSHMDPILEYFEQRGTLLKLTPYRGYNDIPVMIQNVQEWTSSISHKKKQVF